MKKYTSVFIIIVLVLGCYIFFQTKGSKQSTRDAISSGIQQYKKTNTLNSEEETKVKLQLAIASYIAQHSSPPSSLDALVPEYFDQVPIDPGTNKKYEYELQGGSYRLGPLVAKADGSDTNVIKKEDDFLNPNNLEMNDFVYDPNGKRDPFKPFTDKQAVVVDNKTPPLLRYDISQFRVAAVLDDSKGGMFAMVEDSTGIGYPVRSGDAIGINKGKVLSIQKDKIEVLESITNAAGETKQELRSIKLVPAGTDAKNLKNRPKTRVRK